MEEIYVNAEYFKSDKQPSTINPTGPRSSKRCFCSGVIFSLGLLSICLMVGLIITGIYLHDSTASLSAISSRFSSMTEEKDHVKANLSTMSSKLSSMSEENDNLKANLSSMTSKLSSMSEENDNLKANLSSMTSKLFSMSEENDNLKANLSSMTLERDNLKTNLSFMTQERDNLHLTKKTEELERLQKKTCPVGWRIFSCSCYLLSGSSRSWDAARMDCRDRGADLVVIDSSEEQTFLKMITSDRTWIGLNDKEQEGQWKWVDGTSLNFTNWKTNEPNNEGDEDCAHLNADDRKTWNDFQCTLSLKWICEKTP